jgi:hypothetical protein
MSQIFHHQYATSQKKIKPPPPICIFQEIGSNGLALHSFNIVTSLQAGKLLKAVLHILGCTKDCLIGCGNLL